MDDTTTQLLTLLNVSALKRKRPVTETAETPKLNKRSKTVQWGDADAPPTPASKHSREPVTPVLTQNEDDDDEVHSNAPEDELQNEGN